MKRSALFLAWMVLSSQSTHHALRACDCPVPETAIEGLAESVSVFRGAAMEVILGGETSLTRIVFAVDEIWKGPIAPRLEVLTWKNSCGVPFSEDREYIVYADGDIFGESVDGLFTHYCGRTSLFPIESEREALGPPCASGDDVSVREGEVCGESFQRGDANTDGDVDLSDAVSVWNFLFLGAGALGCLDAADANDDSRIDLSDGVTVLNALFAGLPIPAPFGGCGRDPSDDDLGCDDAVGCF